MSRLVALVVLLLAAPAARADLPPPPPPPPPVDLTWAVALAATAGVILAGAWLARRARPRPEVQG